VKKNTHTSLSGADLVELIFAAAQDKLAEKIVSIDLSGMATPADFFVICQGDSTVQNRAIAEEIIDRCAEADTHPWHCEGKEDGRWVLIDFTDVVVHILLPDLRKFYDLESLWSQGKRRVPLIAR
jgi:ribosome-associated protein